MLRRLIVLGLLLVSPSGLSVATAQQRDPDWDDCLQDQALDRQIRGCTAVLNRSGETAARRAIAFSRRGFANLLRGQEAAALADFTEALRLDPRDDWALTNRGLILLNTGRVDEAKADLEAAIRLNPRNDTALALRGLLNQERGDLDAAMADFDEAIRLNPQNGVAFYGRARVHDHRGELRQAAEDFRAALRLGQQHVRGDLARIEAELRAETELRGSAAPR